MLPEGTMMQVFRGEKQTTIQPNCNACEIQQQLV